MWVVRGGARKGGDWGMSDCYDVWVGSVSGVCENLSWHDYDKRNGSVDVDMTWLDCDIQIPVAKSCKSTATNSQTWLLRWNHILSESFDPYSRLRALVVRPLGYGGVHFITVPLETGTQIFWVIKWSQPRRNKPNAGVPTNKPTCGWERDDRWRGNAALCCQKSIAVHGRGSWKFSGLRTRKTGVGCSSAMSEERSIVW